MASENTVLVSWKSLEKLPLVFSAIIGFSFVLSVAFNFGYFYNIGLEFLGFFSLQDYFESSIPFLILGGAFYFLQIVALQCQNFETAKELYQKYKTDWAIRTKKEKIYLALPTFVFFVIQLIGIHALYVFLALATFAYVGFAKLTNIPEIFGENPLSVFWIFGFFALTDFFLKYLGDTQKRGAITAVRFGLAIIYIMGILGAKYLASQLHTDMHPWRITRLDESRSEYVVLLRNLEKGVIVYKINRKAVTLIPWGDIRSIEKNYVNTSLGA